MFNLKILVRHRHWLPQWKCHFLNNVPFFFSDFSCASTSLKGCHILYKRHVTRRLLFLYAVACYKSINTRILSKQIAERVSRYNFQLFLVLWGWSWFCEAGASGSTTKDLRGCPPPHFPVDLDDVYVQGYGFPLSQNQHQ